MCRYNSHKLCAHTASRCSLHNMRRNHDKHTHGKLGEFCPPIDKNTYFNIQIREQGNSIQDADHHIQKCILFLFLFQICVHGVPCCEL